MPLKGLTQSTFASFPSPKPNVGTNTGDATATAADIALGKTAYAVGVKVIGSGTNAKPHANGSGTLPTNVGNLYTDSTGTNQSLNTILITGLSFPNGIDCIKIVVAGTSAPTFYSSVDLINVANCKILVGTGATTEFFIKLQSNATVTTTSFQLPNNGAAGASFTYDVWGL